MGAPGRTALFVALLALVAAASACDGRARPGPVSRAFPPALAHDLVAQLPDALAGGKSVYRVQALGVQPENDWRDVPALLRTGAGDTLEFPGLRTLDEPVLSFTPGAVSDVAAVDDPAPVRLVLEATREGVDGTRSEHALYDATLHPNDFDARGLGAPVTLALPGDGEARWTLRLRTSADAPRERADWLVLFAPRLRSHDGGLREPRPVLVETLHRDLLASLDSASALDEAREGDIVRTTLDAAAGYAGVGGRRVSLRLPAPARVAWELELPDAAELVFAYGVDTRTGWELPGDGTVFAVDVDGEQVWSARLDAHTLRRDRGWKSAQVDLGAWAGRRVELALRSEPGGDARHDVAAFAAPRVVTRASVPRLPRDAAPSVVLVCIDTLRADHVTPQLMPRTLALADSGLRYTQARSSSSWTWPATASLLTGLPPTTHAVTGERSSHLADGIATLAERFAAAGYSTGAVVANLLVGTADNFDQGFERFVHLPNARGGVLNESVETWLDNTADSARFLYLHAYDPHAPYLPVGDVDAAAEAALDKRRLEQLWAAKLAGEVDDAELREQAAGWAASQAARYAAEVRDVDRLLAELVELLDARLGDDWVLAITSDHGEEFLDHGQVSHGPQLFDETLAAPLILVGRGDLAQPPAVIHDALETRALPNTLLALAGLEPLPGDGARLPLRPQAHRASPSFAQTLHGIEPGFEERVEKRSIVHAGHKLVVTPASGRVELFDLAADPGETRELSAEHPERAAQLQELLDDWLERTLVRPGERELADEGAAERLRQLGYLGEDR